MLPGRDPGKVYEGVVPDHQPGRRLLLEDNARKIAQRMDEVIKSLEKHAGARKGNGAGRLRVGHLLVILAPAILAVIMSCVIVIKNPSAEGVLTVVLLLAWGAGLSRYTFVKNRQHRRGVQENYENFIDKIMVKTIWRAGFGHLPGMTDEKGAHIRALALSCRPEKTQDLFEEVLHLRIQYDSDQCAAMIKASSEDAFIQSDWLDGGSYRDTSGMTRLCVAIDNLDLAQVQRLLESGERIDVQVRPYKTLYMNCPLTIAYQARAAAGELADEKDIEVVMAKDMLLERRLGMFALLLEQDPQLWIDTHYNGQPIGLASCFDDPDFEVLFKSFEKKMSLNKLAGLSGDFGEYKPKM